MNPSRRQFIGGALAIAATTAMGRALSGEGSLAFRAVGNEFPFDTGMLRGVLRSSGKSKGLNPMVDEAGSAVSGFEGLFSHYRLLDDRARYGEAAWTWASTARLRDDGAVEVLWSADDDHPFDLTAVYRWAAPNTLDLTTRLTARHRLRRMEVFLASYFTGFPNTLVATGGRHALSPVAKDAGDWQMFPRDAEAVSTIKDGRWARRPHPVPWTIRTPYDVPMTIRRDPGRQLSALVMTRPQDCFAVACPYDGEWHRSVYQCLFGRDFEPGESVAAESRLVVGRNLQDQQAFELYRTFLEHFQ